MSSSPVESGRTELRSRHELAYAGLIVGVLFTVGGVAVLLGSTPGIPRAAQVAVGIALLLVCGILPLLSAWVMLRRRVFLTTDGVEVRSRETLVMTLRWAELDQVRPSYGYAFRGFARRQRQLVLAGRASAGRRAGRYSRLQVTTLTTADFDVLLRAVVAAVQARPELVPTDFHRDLLAAFELEVRDPRG